MEEKFLNKVYEHSGPQETIELYDAWAQSYDNEVGENGYATPGRVAATMAEHIDQKQTPILDFGCGTGLSGLALSLAGFTVIDGMDPSADMIARAQDKRVYRSVFQIDVNDPAPIPDVQYQIITAIGVIGPGAAPASVFHMLMKALPSGGLLPFSLNDHALADASYEAAVNQWLDCGAARLLFKDYGTHLPGRDIKSNVYLIEKN